MNYSFLFFARTHRTLPSISPHKRNNSQGLAATLDVVYTYLYGFCFLPPQPSSDCLLIPSVNMTQLCALTPHVLPKQSISPLSLYLIIPFFSNFILPITFADNNLTQPRVEKRYSNKQLNRNQQKHFPEKGRNKPEDNDRNQNTR